jgi:hypothetical protein
MTVMAIFPIVFLALMVAAPLLTHRRDLDDRDRRRWWPGAR